MGHSDADVLLHAIADALLGAAGLGDIGRHFPDNDVQYKNISSMILLQKTRDLLRNKNYTVINIDATIIAQMPKMAPYIEIMRSNVAKVLSLDKEYINIKATTEEGLGFTGAGQGIAANAITLIEKCENHC